MNTTATPSPTPQNKRHFRRHFRKVTRWKYGEESKFWLWGKIGSNWQLVGYSHDVRNASVAKTAATELPDADKIARLQSLFERGGTRSAKFSPQLVEVAYIAQKGDTIGNAVMVYKPGLGWHSPTIRFDQTKAAADSGWKLWMGATTGGGAFNLYGKWDDPNFMLFAKTLPLSRPDLMERFCDPESGELPPDFLMAAWLAAIAKSRASEGARAYLYHHGQLFCRIDLADGRLCSPNGGGAWITRAAFEKK